ncbi:hypothetical protein [Streptomyces viridochromogenes]|uniref:hypothetical protein n=1 Tax=Streptomyces viridochromogenes TaxID=1938 RepID=UPI000561BAE5|nr:hypothetical protein [Streptomyces viridochromogenes]
MILADSSSTDEVVFFAQGAGFEEGRENSTPYGSEKVWVISGGLFFHYVTNTRAGVSYVQVTGEDEEDVERFTSLARDFFTTIDVAELLSEVRTAKTSDERATAVTRLAVGLPSETPAEALREVLNAFDSEDASIRRAGLLSALYLDWEIVGPRVRNMEVADDVEMLRVQAKYFVDRNDRNEGSS